MHTVVLTELGIAVYQDDAKLYSIPFENPAEEYVAIKQQKSIPADLATRLIKEQSGVLVTDESLMSMLKNESIDAQMAGEEYLEKEMNNVAPNLAIILGTGVAARMLSRTGSLKKLSSLPASTIQVLGAERALFRSLKTGAPPPKHGILFQHTLVHAAPRWQRGKIARAVAAKAVIAARVDVYGNGVNATLMEKLNLRIKEIDTKYSDAPEPRPDAANNERDHNSKAWDKNKDDFKSNRDSKPRGGFRDKDRGSSRDGDRGSFDKFKKRGDDRSSGGYRRDDDKGGFDKFKKRGGDRGSGGYRRDDDRGGFQKRQ